MAPTYGAAGALATPWGLPVIAFVGGVEGVLGPLPGLIGGYDAAAGHYVPSVPSVRAYVPFDPLGIVAAGFLYDAIGIRSTLWASTRAALEAALAVRAVRRMTSE